MQGARRKSRTITIAIGTELPHWPEVRAAMAEIDRMHERSGLDVFVDLHNPGMYDPKTYYLTSPGANKTEIGRRNLARFMGASRAEMTGPLELRTEQKIAGSKYTSGWQAMSQNWVTARTSGHALAFTLEAAWNHPSSTTEGYMTPWPATRPRPQTLPKRKSPARHVVMSVPDCAPIDSHQNACGMLAL